MHTVILAEKFKPYTRQTIASARQWQWLTPEIQEAVQVVSHVRPFRTNAYVLDQLIDWNNVPDDPMFRLTFGHRDMLDAQQYGQLRQLVLADQDPAAIARCVHAIWMEMHPHRAGQMTRDVPRVSDTPLRGVQHKHAQTVLFSPSPGQACHACGTLYFRCPQCAGMENMAFDSSESHQLTAYLKQHKEVSEVLITGDDPMIMSARSLAAAIDPLLGSGLEHIQSIRIGTKLVANWPQRFVTDRDADDVLRLFERVVAAGKNFVLMGHYSHAVELRQEIAQRAVKRIVATGATLRMQGPLIRHVNDESNGWAELWRTGVRLGAIPYGMFAECDTGPQHYFQLPLARAHDVFKEAYQMVPGLVPTVRGPSMSAVPGKVVIDGVTTIQGEKVFALEFLQARNPAWVGKPFYAKFDPQATWMDHLVPAFGQKKFFFEHDEGQSAKIIPLMSAARARHDCGEPDAA